MPNGIFHELARAFTGLMVSSLITTVWVRLAIRWTCGFTPSYGQAFNPTILVVLVNQVIGFFAVLLIPSLSPSLSVALCVVLVPPTFLAGAAIYGKMVKRPDASRVGLKIGCYINLITLLMGLVLAVVIVGAIFLFVIIGTRKP